MGGTAPTAANTMREGGPLLNKEAMSEISGDIGTGYVRLTIGVAMTTAITLPTNP
jgi:hypothetical protein